MTLEMREEVFRLPGRELRLWVVKNLEDLVGDPTDEDQVPCWADIWPAARALAEYIWAGESLGGQKVLELGAGMGLPGMVAALKGGDVVLTDYQPRALEWAAENAARNGIHLQTSLADWRDFPLREQFDRILASDVLYDPKFFPCLWEIVQDNLAPGGSLLVAHPNRPHTWEFLEGVRQRLMVSEQERVVPVEVDDPYFPRYEIYIHRVTRL